MFSPLHLLLLCVLSLLGPSWAAQQTGDFTPYNARWKWSFIDPLPSSIFTSYSAGVADRESSSFPLSVRLPSIRYAHCSAAYKDRVLVSHGYHYDMKGAGATWLSDTWSMDLKTERWTRLHDHVSSLSAGPVARYACSCVVVGNYMYLHGGDDGGHYAGFASYRHAVWGDLWRINVQGANELDKGVWERVYTSVSTTLLGLALTSSSFFPAQLMEQWALDDLYRCQHASTVIMLSAPQKQQLRVGGNSNTLPFLVTVGGLHAQPNDHISTPAPGSLLPEDYTIHDMNDIWILNLETKIWHCITTSFPPPSRFGHSLTFVPSLSSTSSSPAGTLLVYGGFARNGPNLADLWQINIFPGNAQFVWKEMHASLPASSSSPGPRGYHSTLYFGGALHLFGGARCQPGCVCSAEYWVYDMSENERVSSTDRAWRLVCNSPYSPASTGYPSWKSSGYDAGQVNYATAQQSVQTGWPTHRYKQTFVMNVPSVQGNKAKFDAFLFGGESYHPSAYYHDLWRWSWEQDNLSADKQQIIDVQSKLQQQIVEDSHPDLDTQLSYFSRPAKSAFHRRVETVGVIVPDNGSPPLPHQTNIPVSPSQMSRSAATMQQVGGYVITSRFWYVFSATMLIVLSLGAVMFYYLWKWRNKELKKTF